MLDHKRIKDLRIARGLTQAELARLSGITIVTISNIENDHRDTVAGLTLKNLAKALKVKPAELLKGGDVRMEVIIEDESTILGEFQKERTDAISEMFDNVNEDGIYPTTEFFARLDAAVETAIGRARIEAE